MSSAVPRSNEEIAGYYDYMGPFFSILFGKSNHMGMWAPGDDTSISDAQDRLTQAIIDATSLKPGQRLLDVGCGNGRPAVLAAQQTGVTAVGVNLSTQQIEDANKLASEAGLGDKVTFAVEDAMHLPYEDASFDAVWAIEILSHTSDRVAAMREMLRVLRPGGRIVVSDVSERVKLDDAQREGLFAAFLMTSIVSHTDYPKLLSEAGFAEVKVQDLSGEVGLTLTKVLDTYPQKRAAIAAAYGEEMADALARDFPTMSAMQRDNLGYLLMSGVRPA
ncbi:methyltransferase domain-containing protein [Catelliglobosispora koreensis]|uniref:methyltransferase domain-containing protein n=1 Tax=Catelliglobosispora koreensis TaxID=129052 RepID=UPI000590D894|nr:methyltransferase domain-containing protein [Catelliglobosispora koreensis]